MTPLKAGQDKELKMCILPIRVHYFSIEVNSYLSTIVHIEFPLENKSWDTESVLYQHHAMNIILFSILTSMFSTAEQ